MASQHALVSSLFSPQPSWAQLHTFPYFSKELLHHEFSNKSFPQGRGHPSLSPPMTAHPVRLKGQPPPSTLNKEFLSGVCGHKHTGTCPSIYPKVCALTSYPILEDLSFLVEKAEKEQSMGQKTIVYAVLIAAPHTAYITYNSPSCHRQSPLGKEIMTLTVEIR